MDRISFGTKLEYLKKTFAVTDGEIGGSVGVVASLVCRWRSGERTLDPNKDAHIVKLLAAFFIERAVLGRRRPQLAQILSLSEADIEPANDSCIAALADFFYDGRNIDADSKEKDSAASDRQEQGGNFIGIRGVMAALALLEAQIQDCPDVDITVYLSLDYSRLFQDEAASGIWDLLCRMNRGVPVRVVFDGWLDNTEKVAQNLKALLLFMQTGKIRLSVIKSTQKFFYYNLTFFAKNAGMVVSAEPIGGAGACISLLASDPGYMSGMGDVFSDIDRVSKSLARYFTGASAKDEAVYYGRLFEPKDDLQILTSGLDLLYMDEAGYLSLLKLNGIKGSQRSYRHAKFIEDKRRFDAFLAERRVREIINLPAIDDIIKTGILKTPDFSFHEGEIKADTAILKNLLTGLLSYIERYGNLSVYLERGDNGGQDYTCRIKGDNSVLLHTLENGQTHIVYSDNWMLVYEYIKQFQEALQSERLMNIKSAVKTALQIRLDNLGGF